MKYLSSFSILHCLFFCLFILGQTACKNKECPQGCEHGGSCANGICNCPEGYAGVSCEIKLNPCYVLGCDTLHSRCDTTGSTPFCVCDPGWEGSNCDKTWIEKYIGSYNASEVCDGTGQNFTIETLYAPKEMAFTMKYFHNALSGGNPNNPNDPGLPAKIIADLHSPNNFLIAPQIMSFGTISGSGEFYPSTKSMLIYFTIVKAGDSTSCQLTLERQ